MFASGRSPDIEFECVNEKCDRGPPKRGMPMKAAFIERHGGPEVLKFGEVPDPVAASGEVVVDIVAASVNGADWKVREGKSGQLSRFPYILGRDFSVSFQRLDVLSQP